MRFFAVFILVCVGFGIKAQPGPKVPPTKVSTAVYFDKTPPLKELIGLAAAYDFAENKRNEDLKKPRLYPYAATALPQGPDPLWQRQQGTRSNASRALIQSFDGMSGTSDPLDNNGSIGPNHYMQGINVDYSIFDRNGNVVVAATAFNTLFAGVPGASNNDGDPIVMYDGQADRWFAAEFSGIYSDPDYMLIAISQTNDPTGSWYRWSFVMNGFPDYMKFGIAPNAYLMGVNSSGDDIYAFERNVMLAGGANPQMVQFKNPNRPQSGFHVVLPMDTDGPFASTPGPGQFITINDDAWDGGSDQIWIYDLNVDWSNPGAATFQRTQTINVAPFDSDFGFGFDNISQPNSQKLDAIPQVLMHRAQKRVFGNTESVVCVHTVDVDGTDHAGLRWYELTRSSGGQWAVRQSGTYAPDGDSRWMGSIAQNGNHEIAIGYNVSSTTTFPSIRYCGQSATEYANASGILDIAETSIIEGTAAQNTSNRWGDYANLAVDPVDDHTFWFTSTYNISGSERGTKVASWDFSPPAVIADFSADKLKACVSDVVTFTDLSTGAPTSWQWTITPATFSFVNGTNANSQNPQIQFSALGTYTIALTASNANSSDVMTKTNYITVQEVVADFAGGPANINTGQSVTFTDASGCNPDSWSWAFPGGTPANFSGANPPPVVYNTAGTYDVTLTVTKGGSTDVQTKTGYVVVTDCTPCTTNYSNTTDEYISRVTIGNIDNQSLGTSYSDFTNLSTDVTPGSTHQLQVEITVNGNWSEHVMAWVDWNGNCTFEAGNETYDLGTTSGNQGVETLTTNIAVPAGVSLGTKIMRIAVRYNTPPGPCDNVTYGEAEDYSVNVVNAPLPVQLSDFYGLAEKGYNLLSWQTSREINSSHFVLEKSVDGIKFEPLGTVPAAGNSQGPRSYSVRDDSPEALAYYRVRTVDADGAFEFSKIIALRQKIDGFAVLSAFPNPADRQLSLRIQSPKATKVPLYIVTNSGEVMKMQQIALVPGITAVDVDLLILPAGQYYVKIGDKPGISFVKK